MRFLPLLILCLALEAHAQTPAPELVPKVDMADAERVESKEVVYPPLAKRLGAQARISGWVYLDSDGKPLRATIGRRVPAHMDFFDETVREHLMATRYRPMMRDGVGQAGWVKADYNFVLERGVRDGPQLLKAAEPEIPREAVAQGVEGWVAIVVRVDSLGRPEAGNLIVWNRSPQNFAYFDAPAKAAVLRSTFETGVPAGALVVRVDFKLPAP